MASLQNQNGAAWTPQLVEDLIARQFLHNQDVSAIRPPAPLAARNVNVQNTNGAGSKQNASSIVPFTDATKQYMKFFNQTANNNNSNNNNQQNQTMFPQPLPTPTHHHQMVGSSTAATIMSPSAKTNHTGASPRFAAATSQHQQQGASMFPTTSSSSSSVPPPPSPSSHHQLQQLQQIQQQLNTHNAHQHQQQQNNSIATAQQQQQQRPHVRQTDCVASCKPVAQAKVRFPPHIPSNEQLVVRPDPENPKKSLCPSATLMMQRIMAQQSVDADLIFAQPKEEFPLAKIFAAYPQALQVIANARGESGDWRSDTFTKEEEAKYKRDMGYTVFGPYQARANNFGGPL